jgi:site-specific recombinase XerD
MSSKHARSEFHSPLAQLIEQFIQEKQACGHKYDVGTRLLQQLDEHLADKELNARELPWPVTREWIAKRPHESASTQQHRISIVRQFALFMCRMGYPATVPDRSLSVKDNVGFAPRVLNHDEVQRLLHAVDQLSPAAHAPLRHRIMPEIFRLLYGCGFRVNEVLQLKVGDVDLQQGVITVRQGKFCKDRLVPPAMSLVKRLREYAAYMEHRSPDAFFFPSPRNGAWSKQATYHLFRKLLLESGIPHGGRGKGPRLHDLRHTFAVHALLRWYQDGADLNAKLLVLAAYLGHQSLNGTQRYLHLTAELFPQITQRASADFGDVIPRRVCP